jgi:hypothetical protein
MRLIGLGLVALASAGCYSYIPVSPASPPPIASRVAADLTTKGSVENMQRLGADATSVEGRLVRTAEDSVFLAIEKIRNRDGRYLYWSGERLGFDQEYIAGMRTRKISKAKTVLAIVGVAAAMYATASSGLIGSGGDGVKGDPVGNPPGTGQ